MTFVVYITPYSKYVHWDKPIETPEAAYPQLTIEQSFQIMISSQKFISGPKNTSTKLQND